jgi:ABC-type methionine transport system permease subunit
MDKHYIASLSADLAKAFWERFQMVGISMAIAVAVGVPMGLIGNFLMSGSRSLPGSEARCKKLQPGEQARNDIPPA